MAGQKGGGWGGTTGREASWDEFDCLPTGVKRFFWHAPYPYSAAQAADLYRRVGDMRGLVQTFTALNAAAVRREAKRLYGAAHPQAVA